MRISAIALAVFLLITSCVYAQNQFSTDYLSFDDSVNSGYLPASYDHLSVLLMRGFLDRKIRGYQFNVKEETLKWLPLRPDEYPKAWDPKEFYFLWDEVTYKGKIYQMNQEIRPSPITPDKGNHWVHLDRKGAPLKTIRYFPALKDTISPAQFLLDMIRDDGRMDDIPWQPGYDYYTNDEVTFNGNFYEALKDNRDVRPGNKEYWVSITPSPQFIYLGKRSAVRILNHYVAVSADTTWSPQTLTLVAFDESIFMHTKSVITFFYCDAMRYLESVSQPMALFSTYGHLGNSIFYLDPIRKTRLMNLIRQHAATGGLMVGTIDADQLQKFMSIPKDMETYSVSQDLLSKTLTLNHTGKPFATVTAQSVLQLPEVKNEGAASLYPISAALRARIFNKNQGSSQLDSLIPLNSCEKRDLKSATDFVYREEHQLIYRNQHERMLLTRAWNHLVTEMTNGTLQKVKDQRFDEIRHPWSEEFKRLDKVYDDLSDEGVALILARASEPEFGYKPNIRTDSARIGLTIVYEKKFSAGSFSFQPVIVSVYDGTDEYYGRVASFSWASVKNSLLRIANPSFMDVITRIENGTVPLGESEVVSGLHEDK